MRKRLFILFLFFAAIIVFGQFAYAARYSLGLSGADVYFPDEILVFTADTDANDSRLSITGFSHEELIEHLDACKLSLFGIDLGTATQFEIGVSENELTKEIGDLTKLSSYDRKKFAQMLMQLSADAYSNSPVLLGSPQRGYSFLSYFLQKTDQATYIVFEMMGNDLDNAVIGQQFLTIMNGQYISFSAKAQRGQYGARQTNMLLDIVENTTFVDKARQEFPVIVLIVGALGTGAAIFTIRGARKRMRDTQEQQKQRASLSQRRITVFCQTCGTRIPASFDRCLRCGAKKQ